MQFSGKNCLNFPLGDWIIKLGQLVRGNLGRLPTHNFLLDIVTWDAQFRQSSNSFINEEISFRLLGAICIFTNYFIHIWIELFARKFHFVWDFYWLLFYYEYQWFVEFSWDSLRSRATRVTRAKGVDFALLSWIAKYSRTYGFGEKIL